MNTFQALQPVKVNDPTAEDFGRAGTVRGDEDEAGRVPVLLDADPDRAEKWGLFAIVQLAAL